MHCRNGDFGALVEIVKIRFHNGDPESLMQALHERFNDTPLLFEADDTG